MPPPRKDLDAPCARTDDLEKLTRESGQGNGELRKHERED